jgi:hypothetical protein
MIGIISMMTSFCNHSLPIPSNQWFFFGGAKFCHLLGIFLKLFVFHCKFDFFFVEFFQIFNSKKMGEKKHCFKHHQQNNLLNSFPTNSPITTTFSITYLSSPFHSNFNQG